MIKDDVCRPFEMQEIDLTAELSKDWKFNLRYAFNFFNAGISIAPPKISCTTCHKVPISSIPQIVTKATEFDYDELSGQLITATVALEFNSIEVTARVKWIEELKYPLMFIEEIKSKN